jgi:hypothetical protein
MSLSRLPLVTGACYNFFFIPRLATLKTSRVVSRGIKKIVTQALVPFGKVSPFVIDLPDKFNCPLFLACLKILGWTVFPVLSPFSWTPNLGFLVGFLNLDAIRWYFSFGEGNPAVKLIHRVIVPCQLNFFPFFVPWLWVSATISA